MKIDPDTVYTEEELAEAFGIPRNSLVYVLRSRGLKHNRISNRYFILGRWFLDWLEKYSMVNLKDNLPKWAKAQASADLIANQDSSTQDDNPPE